MGGAIGTLRITSREMSGNTTAPTQSPTEIAEIPKANTILITKSQSSQEHPESPAVTQCPVDTISGTTSLEETGYAHPHYTPEGELQQELDKLQQRLVELQDELTQLRLTRETGKKHTSRLRALQPVKDSRKRLRQYHHRQALCPIVGSLEQIARMEDEAQKSEHTLRLLGHAENGTSILKIIANISKWTLSVYLVNSMCASRATYLINNVITTFDSLTSLINKIVEKYETHRYNKLGITPRSAIVTLELLTGTGTAPVRPGNYHISSNSPLGAIMPDVYQIARRSMLSHYAVSGQTAKDIIAQEMIRGIITGEHEICDNKDELIRAINTTEHLRVRRQKIKLFFLFPLQLLFAISTLLGSIIPYHNDDNNREQLYNTTTVAHPTCDPGSTNAQIQQLLVAFNCFCLIAQLSLGFLYRHELKTCRRLQTKRQKQPDQYVIQLDDLLDNGETLSHLFDEKNSKNAPAKITRTEEEGAEERLDTLPREYDASSSLDQTGAPATHISPRDDQSPHTPHLLHPNVAIIAETRF